MKRIVGLALLLFAQLGSWAQSLPVGFPATEDYFRRSQLQGLVDSNVSFTVRPVFPNSIDSKATVFYTDNQEKRFNLLNLKNLDQLGGKKVQVQLLPFSFQSQINSDHPYGWNDGSMIPAAGLQTQLSGGVYLKYGVLSFQFKPEIVVAENADFENFNHNQYDVIFARYYDIYNNIDLPVQFGTSTYTKAYWGQSSIRLNYKAFSFGLSTENLWWGPGIRNSLLMSNTAPGFKHLTLNTLRPIKTAIGSFEGQIIAGRLENSNYAPLQPDHDYFGTNLNVPKPNDWRYLSGFVLTWHPKWVSGLFLGYDQSSQAYGKNLSGVKDYLPFFSPVKTVSAPDQPINKQDRLSAAFMRWVWEKEHAEVYFEFGHYNNPSSFLQTLLAPERARAYIFGLRKLMPFNTARNEHILISLEATQLQETNISDILTGKEWYVSQGIRQGYTNRGEVIGAGIGPGANLQTLDVSWVRGLKRLGIQLERYVHNDDFVYYAFSDSQDYSRHWVDLSLAASGEWNYKNLIFNGKVQGIQSLDYQWYLNGNHNDPTFVNQTSKFNLQVQAGVSYRF